MVSDLHMWFSMALGATDGSSFFFPPAASTVAGKVDSIYNFILYLDLFFFVGIVAVMFLFMRRYRRSRMANPIATPGHHTLLEVVWTVVPSLLLVLMFVAGVATYIHLRTPPQNALEIQVTAQKWNWSFTYPDGTVSPDLHVPVDQDVRLVLRSEDVIHSFYVPAFRVKMDAVPGRYTTAWFNATQTGKFQIFCTEYCGTKHSGMLAQVYVHTSSEYDAWVNEASNASNKPPAELGKDLYTSRGCMQCHSVDGATGIGPSFKGLFGKQESLVGGAKVAVDENYIRESILEPQAKVVNGYAPVMPTFQGKLKDVEITGLIEYIKTLR